MLIYYKRVGMRCGAICRLRDQFKVFPTHELGCQTTRSHGARHGEFFEVHTPRDDVLYGIVLDQIIVKVGVYQVANVQTP